MSYKVIIVDDENKMREGLAKFVDWKSMGYEVVAKLNDGREAIEYIEKNSVDAILSDIKMTFISGIELAKYVYEKKKNIKVVLISGFREFEYAKQAIQYNVVNYLLKPASTEDIQNVFSGLKIQMDKEVEIKQKELNEKQQLEEVVSILKEEFFTDLFLGALRNESEINRKIKLLNLDYQIEKSKCCTITIKIDKYEDFVKNNWNYGREGLYTAVRNFFQTQNLNIDYYSIGQSNKSVTFIAVNKKPLENDKFVADIQTDLGRVQNEIKRFLDLDISAIIEKNFNSIFELAKDSSPFDEHVNNPQRKIENMINDKSHLKMEEQIKLMVTHISAGNYKMCLSLFELFLEEARALDVREINHFITNLFTTLKNRLMEIGINASTLNEEGFYFDNVEEIRLWGENKLKAAVDQINSNTNNVTIDPINKVKLYIKENYNKDITLKDSADYIYLNSAYLSRLFKEKTGENFSDYLIKTRMQKAIELLKDSRYKVHEISTMIGYDSLRYFYKLFKRYYELTPTEYRKLLYENETEIE